MSRIERARVYSLEEREARSVALAQPHRMGSDSILAGTALGRFCLRWWRDEGAQREYCDVGERYARLMDDERSSRGLSPRQHSENGCGLESMDHRARQEWRVRAASALQNASDAIREVDHRAVTAIQILVYEDRDILANLEGRAYNGLYRLRVHFERVDKTRTRA